MLCYFYNAVASGSSNIPFATSGMIAVKRYSTNIIQEATQASTGTVYTRTSNNTGSSWSSWKRITTNADLEALKTTDFIISKDVALMALQVNGNTYAKIMKNAVNGKADYGTCIIDYTNGVKTEIKIQNGKMWLDGKEVATK